MRRWRTGDYTLSLTTDGELPLFPLLSSPLCHPTRRSQSTSHFPHIWLPEFYHPPFFGDKMVDRRKEGGPWRWRSFKNWTL
jgi:hypothetical protein